MSVRMLGHEEEISKQSMEQNSINQKMQFKAQQKDLRRVESELKRFALYEDYKKLYNMTMEPMKNFQEEMIVYKKEHE